jgi:hypothetical protein
MINKNPVPLKPQEKLNECEAIMGHHEKKGNFCGDQFSTFTPFAANWTSFSEPLIFAISSFDLPASSA